jgi:hypothetical protein
MVEFVARLPVKKITSVIFHIFIGPNGLNRQPANRIYRLETISRCALIGAQNLNSTKLPSGA